MQSFSFILTNCIRSCKHPDFLRSLCVFSPLVRTGEQVCHATMTLSLSLSLLLRDIFPFHGLIRCMSIPQGWAVEWRGDHFICSCPIPLWWRDDRRKIGFRVLAKSALPPLPRRFSLSGSNLSDALQAQQGFDWLFFEGFLSRNNKTPP